MKITHETEVLKGENADLLAILSEMCTFIRGAAYDGTAMHEVEHAAQLDPPRDQPRRRLAARSERAGCFVKNL